MNRPTSFRTWLRSLFGERAERRGLHNRYASVARQISLLEDRCLLTTFVVDSLEDRVDASDNQTSLREALAIASSSSGNATIRFAPTLSGTIALTMGEFLISTSVSIIGNGSAHTIIDARGNSRIFNITDGSVSIEGLGLTRGKSDDGGAIKSTSSGTLTISGSSITDSVATLSGGAVYIGDGKAIIMQSTLSNNSAAEVGGGICALVSTLRVIESTLSGNSATSGGAIGVAYTSTEVVQSTITGNSATQGGGFDSYYGDSYYTATFENSIISNNDGNDITRYDVDSETTGGVIISHSLVGSTAGFLFPDGNGNLKNVDAKLGPLQNNGGSSPTHSLLPGSPAINAGSNALIPDSDGEDQRGGPFARIAGGTVDMGAIEPQLKAFSIEYVTGNTIADDEVVLKYDISAASASIDLAVYWSAGADGLAGVRDTAVRRPADADGEIRIKATSLRVRPSTPVTHLVFHIDDDTPSNLNGRVGPEQGDTDSDNYAALRLLPDIVIEKLHWGTATGGLDIEYKVDQRALLDQALKFPVNAYWNDTLSAFSGAVSIFATVGGTHTFIPGAAFFAPQMDTSFITVVLDKPASGSEDGVLEEANEENWLQLSLPDVTPEVEVVLSSNAFLFDGTHPLRKKDYSVALTIKNTAPFPVNVLIDWEETAANAWETGTAENPLDATTGTRAASEVTGHELALPFGFVPTTVSLNGMLGKTFNRTWNWIPPDFQGTTESTVEEWAAEAHDWFVKISAFILKWRGSPFAKLGEELGTIKEGIDALKDFERPVTADSVSVKYGGLVTAKANNGQDAAEFSELYNLVVPNDQKQALEAMIITNAALKQVANKLEEYGDQIVAENIRDAENMLRTLRESHELFRQAIDPPDLNYTSVLTAADILQTSSRSVAPGVIDSQIRSATLLLRLREAIGLSADRAVGAQGEDAIDWQAAQIEAVARLATELAYLHTDGIVLSDVMQSRETFLRANPSSGELTSPVQIIANLVSQGLEPEFVPLLQNLFADQSNEQQFPVDAESALARLASGYAIEQAMRTLRECVAIRVDLLKEPVIEISTVQRAALDSQRTAIEALLESEPVTREQVSRIRDFIDDVTDLMLSTKNVSALESDLQFGFGALCWFQQSDFRIAKVSALVSEWRATGHEISSELGNAILELLGDAEEQLSRGEFDAVLPLLKSMDAIVAGADPGALSDERAHALLGYSSFLQEFFAYGVEPEVLQLVDSDESLNVVVESSPDGTVVGITAQLLEGGATHSGATYTLTMDAEGRFMIDPVTGVVRLVGGMDYESGTSHQITVQAASADGSTTSQVYTIQVTDVDEFNVTVPVDVNGPVGGTVAESLAVGAAVGITASASDADGTTNAITYSLTSNPGGLFAIHPTTGVVTLSASLNYEAATSHQITIQAASADGSTASQVFTIHVTDVDEFNVSPVTDVNAAANTIAENAASGTAVGITASAVDADGSNNIVSFALTDDAGGRFTIHPGSGVVTVAPGAVFDFDVAGSHQITVQATSTDGSTSSTSFSITVTPVNFGQDLSPTTMSVPENRPRGTVVGQFTVANSNGLPKTYTFIRGRNDNSRFTLTKSGQLKTKSRFNYEQRSTYDIVVQVRDAGGFVQTKTIRVNVANVNERPTALRLSSSRIAENNTIGARIGTLLGVDPDSGDPLNYTLVSGRGSRDNARFAIVGNELRAAEMFNYERKRSYSVRVRVTDASGLRYEKQLTIRVTNVRE